MAVGRYRLFVGKDQQYYFSLKAPNGRVILQSEGYKALAGAENGIDSVRNHSSSMGNYELKTAKNGEFYFVLKAANHQVIGASEMYITQQGAQEGLESVMAFAPSAEVDREDE